MRWIAMAAAAATTGLAVAAPVFQESFETGTEGRPADWAFVQSRGDCSGAWDTNEPLPSGRSVRLGITGDATARATWTCSKRVPVKGSTRYRLSVRIMMAQVAPSARVYLIAYENGLEDPAHWHHTPFLSGTEDWRTHAVTFVTGPEATWLRLQCKLWEGTGYAWFDDIVLEELVDDEAVDAEEVSQRPPPADDGWPLQMWWYPAQRRPDGTLCLLEGSLNPVGVFFWGRKDEVQAPYLVIETPEGIRVDGTVVQGRAPMPEPVQIAPQAAEATSGRVLRWRLPLQEARLREAMGTTGPVWTQYHYVYVEPVEGCPREFEWRWRLETGGQLGPEHSIPARLLARQGEAIEPVPGFDLYAQHTGALRYPTAEGRRRVLDYLYYAGIRGGLSLTHYQPEYAFVDRELERAGFFLWAWNWNGYGGSGQEDQRLVFQDGSISKALLCPELQAQRWEPWWEQQVALYRRALASGLKTLIINYEPPYFDCCFCQRCRAAFARFAGRSEEQVVSMAPADLQRLPDDLWGRFRSEQNARIVKNHAGAIHEVDPEARVGICGPPYLDYTAKRGMDIRLFEPEVVIHAPMIYVVGTTYEYQFRSTCENTTAPVLPFLLASDLAVEQVFPLPDDVRLNMLATALSGGRGAILWVGIESLDGDYLQALRRSMEEIRELEPYILGGHRAADVKIQGDTGHGRTVQVDGKTVMVTQRNELSPLRWWAWRSTKGRLAGFINYDPESSHAARISGEGVAKARALFGPDPRPDGGEALVELGPGEFGAYVW